MESGKALWEAVIWFKQLVGFGCVKEEKSERSGRVQLSDLGAFLKIGSDFDTQIKIS